MQNPGQQVSQLAHQNSVSTLLARVRARSAGTPMPYAAQGPVENSESGRGPEGEGKTRVFQGWNWECLRFLLWWAVTCIDFKAPLVCFFGIADVGCFPAMIIAQVCLTFVRLMCFAGRIHPWQGVPHDGSWRHVLGHRDACCPELDFLHHGRQDPRQVILFRIWARQLSLGLWHQMFLEVHVQLFPWAHGTRSLTRCCGPEGEQRFRFVAAHVGNRLTSQNSNAQPSGKWTLFRSSFCCALAG